MSFHNKQGMDNILPIAEKLCEDNKNEITLLDLRSTYSQLSSNLEVSENILVNKDTSIFKNIRNLNKISKLIYIFSKFFLNTVYNLLHLLFSLNSGLL